MPRSRERRRFKRDIAQLWREGGWLGPSCPDAHSRYSWGRRTAEPLGGGSPASQKAACDSSSDPAPPRVAPCEASAEGRDSPPRDSVTIPCRQRQGAAAPGTW